MTMENRDDSTLDRILGPTEPEVTCEQCFELLDQYVELELAGADTDAQLPGVRAHLAGCPACREDHKSLRDLVKAEVSGPDQPRR
jgi:predicted anti-sigma-YlaC factor YlaD